MNGSKMAKVVKVIKVLNFSGAGRMRFFAAARA
jgi:hypothetical protein